MARVVINNESSMLTAPIEVKLWYNTLYDDVQVPMEFEFTQPIGLLADACTTHTCKEITRACVYLTTPKWKIKYLFYTMYPRVPFKEININITDGNQCPIVKVNNYSADKKNWT